MTTPTEQLIPKLPIIRPNGKTYRPRAIVAHAWENPDDMTGDNYQGCIIIGTHDAVAAQPFAERMCNYWFGTSGAKFMQAGWFRKAYDYTGPAWIEDDVRGSAGCYFSAVDS